MNIGIDPGKNGAIAAIDDLRVMVLPRLGKWSNHDILVWLTDIVASASTPPRCVMEKVHSSPQMGVVSAFSFGQEFGRIQAILAAQAIPTRLVSPQAWQRGMYCLTKGNKNVTKAKAKSLFPDQHITHVTADALLIAEYCRRKEKEIFADAA